MEIRKQQRKVNKIKSWFFEKISKICNPMARLAQKKKKTQIPKLAMKEETSHCPYKNKKGNK